MSTHPRRILALLAGSLLLTFPLTGVAAAQTADETGHYSGAADASVLNVTAGDAADEVADGVTLVDASVAPTETAADTRSSLTFGEEDGLSSFGYGANLSGAIADGGEGAGPVEVLQTAPPDNDEPESETLIEVPAEPLVESHVFSGEALARDCAEVACPEDDLVSFGWSQINETQLFPEGADGEHAVHLDDAVETRSEISLTDVEGQDTKGVQARSTASVSSIDLFGGQDADALTIELLSEPTLTAVAGGTPGSAEVTYDAPVVLINGEGFEADPGEEQRLTIPPDAEPGEEDLLLDISFGNLDQSTAGDGTHASGEASVLDITLLSAVEQGTLGSISVAPMSVEANAPDGGVDCPALAGASDDGLDVDVDGPEEVGPGDEFDYTIDVTNPLDCPIADLVVVSEITGPDGAEVTATDPEGTVDGLTVTWGDLDELAPDDTATFTVTVSVPDDAEEGVSFRNDVTATGDCDGDDVSGAGALDGPVVADDGAVLGATDAPDDTADDRPAARERLPETGGGIALLGLAALGMATALRRRGA